MSKKLNSRIRFLLKLLLALALIIWVVKSGKLDPKSFTFLMSSPLYLSGSYSLLLVSALIMGALRFRMMLELCELRIPYLRSVRYQGIGLFANVFMPSAVGGDALKAYYVKSDYAFASVPKIVLAVLLDRIVGMMSIFAVGVVVSFLDFGKIMRVPQLRILFIANVLFFVAIFGFFALCHVIHRHEERALRILKKIEQRFSLLQKPIGLIREATFLIGRNPKILGLTTIISVANQVCLMLLFWLITRLFGDQDISMATVALIYPIGSLLLVIPLTPGGFGVGHVAFDQLFSLFGYQGGANYFNIYFLSGVLFNLSMIIFYLSHKKIKERPEILPNGVEHAEA